MSDCSQPSEQPRTLARIEDSLSIAVMGVMSLLAVAEIIGREWLGRSIPGSIALVQHLTLWIVILGAALAARSDRLLALSTQKFIHGQWRRATRIFTSSVAVGVTACLFLASLDLVEIERPVGDIVAWGIPLWVALMVLPIGFALIVGRLIGHASETRLGRLLAASGLSVPVLFGLVPSMGGTELLLPVGGVILAAVGLGMPLFTAIAGAALLLFWVDGTPINAVPGETYRLAVNAMLPAIPLFTLGGYILAEGGTSRRLLRLFRALVGWMPGGLAVATTFVLALFTPLTGASGVTILSMGGLLLPVLLQARYPEKTSVGLVTVSGSIGLFIPPSLPVILYAYSANQRIEELFIGGLLPGTLLIGVVAGWGARQGWLKGAVRTPFHAGEAAAALWESKWELLLPVVVLGSWFGGLTTLVEAAALSVLYALLIECLVYKDLNFWRDLPRVFVESATIVGGFMIILGVALGFTNYLIIAEIPELALSWVHTHIESPLVFLLVLNVFLIMVGALMDIYSAIFVVVPLIIPMATAYHIDPIHLGIIFLANMELGYLMPPMGENLFLSSYRFKQSLTQVYRSTLPFTVILLMAVLVITYVPVLTLGLVELWGR